MIAPRRYMRVLARLDSEGRVPLPPNVRRALGLKQNQVLEVRTIGCGRSRGLMLRPRFSR